MCGLTGFFKPGGLNAEASSQIAQAMASRIEHRGPDDAGVWLDAASGVVLAHRRLSILDLSSAGHQPMVSASGRYVIAFNGEIYNHLALRSSLSVAWRSQTDTETLLESIEALGLPEALKRCVGMFAFALWDKKDQTLSLARDRLGEKPLYYRSIGGSILFASELKAIKQHPDFKPEINRDALASFLRHSQIPAPYSIYKGIYKLPPGTWLKIGMDLKVPKPVAYWSMLEVAEFGQGHLFKGDINEASDELESLLNQSIAGQMLADVPLGAFLSGGVDSSMVVALMQAQSSRPIKTFTIGFEEQAYDEARYARAVANHLGSEHTELYVSATEALAVIPKLPFIYDEPFSDASAIPTWLVSNLARQHVTVSLSGDGGDELFGGYHRYFLGQTLWKRLGGLPLGLRKLLAHGLTSFSPDQWDRFFYHVFPYIPSKLRFSNPGDKLQKLAGVLPSKDAEHFYLKLISHWEDAPVLGCHASVLNDRIQPKLPELAHRMMVLDGTGYLPDDILTKVDRAAMSVSLETRVPFLDHRLVEFAWRLPLSMKIDQGVGKHVVRQLLYRHVPKELIERPKMGFAIPLDRWLRGPLREWAESLLDEKRLDQEGFLIATPIRQKWSEHLSGRRNWQYHIWDVLMFQAWLEAQR